ncbi:MAG: formylglycine-generating enzyme family protein [Planctomycetota bacterium]
MVCVGCKHETRPAAPSASATSRTSTPPSRSVEADPYDPTHITFATIPSGNIRTGSVTSEPGRDSRMERRVTVAVEPFEISQTEITVAQYLAITAPGSRPSSSEANLPINNITWFQAKQFCEVMTIRTGVRHRLPTEAEWEFACRAGTTGLISVWNGRNSLEESIRSYHRGDPGKITRGLKASCNVDTSKVMPVAQFPINAFGLYDTHGNVWEWISDDDTITEPPSPLHAPIRGGSAISTNVFECRSANRAWQFKDNSTDAIGFRVVREIY